MKILRNISVGLVLLGICLSVASIFLPDEVQVQRDIVVDTQIEEVLFLLHQEDSLVKLPPAGVGDEVVWQFEPVGDKTRISWSVVQHMGRNPFRKYKGLILDATIGPVFEQGLIRIAEQLHVLRDQHYAIEAPLQDPTLGRVVIGN